MNNLEITQRYGKSLSPNGSTPNDQPDWVNEVDHPYLHGVFAPTTLETESGELEVEGEIPKDLFGSYFRNGTNPRFKPLNRYHWFDGDGMVYGIHFENGKASYRNRWIRTEGFKMEEEKQNAIWPGVLGPFNFELPLAPIKDTANTDLIFYNKQLCGLWYESGKAYTLDPRSLETTGFENFNNELKMPLSAHSKIDPNTGDLIVFSYGDRPPYMKYGVVSAEGKVHSCDIDLPGPRRPHDVGVSANYSILHDFPLFFDPEHFKRTGKRVPLFHPDVPTRFGVLPRWGTNSDVQWFECKPCYMLHTVNCYEEGDWVVQIGCRTDDPSLKLNPEDGDIAAMLAGIKLQANLYEWRFNLKTGVVIEGHIDHYNAEFPSINRNFMGRKNRYTYLQDIPYEIPATFEGIIKFDLDNNSYEKWDYGQGVYGSETPFAPRYAPESDNLAEDDGYLVSFITDTKDWISYCVILDAQNIEPGPIARIKLPHRLPAGFHTLWVPGEDMA